MTSLELTQEFVDAVLTGFTILVTLLGLTTIKTIFERRNIK